MSDTRPYLLALALEAAPLGVVRLARPAWRRSAYAVTLVVEPDTAENQWTVQAWTDAGSLPDEVYEREN